jgi:cytochrome P450
MDTTEPAGTESADPADFLTANTVIEDYDEIMEVLKSANFRTAMDAEESLDFHVGVIANIDGPEHFQRRRVESRLFTNEALTYLQLHALQPIITGSLAAAAAQRSADGMVRTELRGFLIGVMHRLAAMVTGIDGVDTAADVDRFNDLIDTIQLGNIVEFAKGDHAPLIAAALEAKEALRREYYLPSYQRRAQLVARHRAGDLELSVLPRDLITLLLLNYEQDWDDDLPLREVAIYLDASTRTTTRTAVHIVDHVAAWIAAHPADRDSVHEGIFLRRAAAESLRLHPVLPALSRRAAGPCELRSGRQIAAGERLMLLFSKANQDPRIFGSDAAGFDPYRQDRLEPGTMPWGISFGGGVHMCIGRRMVTGGDWFAKGATARADTEQTGTLVALLLALYQAGIEPDPDESAVRQDLTHFDEHARYPARFSTL